MAVFISAGKERQFAEGTTEGDPVAMVMYATGMFPLLYLNEKPNEMNEKAKRLARLIATLKNSA